MASDWDWMNAAKPVGSGNDFAAGNWQLPNVPNLPNTYYPDFLKGKLGEQWRQSLQQPWGANQAPFDLWNNASWTDEATRGNMKSWLENLGFPLAQMQQNQQKQAFDQWQSILNMNNQNQMNQFNMGQQNWTNQFQKWAADLQNQQFAKQLGLDTDVAKWRFGEGGLEQQNIDTQRYGVDQTTYRAMQELENQRRLQEMIGSQQMEQLQKSNANQLLQSRYQAFGRAQAPNARWTGNW